MVDLAVRMFCQAKECGGVAILLLCGGKTGGYPAPLYLINADRRQAGAGGHALRQPLTSRVDRSLAQVNFRQRGVDLCQVQGIFELKTQLQALIQQPASFPCIAAVKRDNAQKRLPHAQPLADIEGRRNRYCCIKAALRLPEIAQQRQAA